MIKIWRRWRCSRGHHTDRSSVVGVTGVQVEWTRNLCISDVSVVHRCIVCARGVIYGVTVWKPLRHMDIPNMCEKCQRVHEPTLVECP